MKRSVAFFCGLLLVACSETPASPAAAKEPVIRKKERSAVERHYDRYAHVTGESRSVGTVGNGRLENGYILPFSGKNFRYFDTLSYMKNRCFVHSSVLQTLINGYRRLETETPARHYGIMECSNEHGGRIYPHRTHQNGLSVDFMTPLLKDGQPYTALDTIGARHYLMDFDSEGRYKADKTVSIDFETMARHLLVMIDEAQQHGLKTEKIIWKMQLQDELFATPSGKKLQATGVYVTKQLSPLINALHDDHYHVDFAVR